MFTRTKSNFECQGVRCSGDLYLPGYEKRTPIVVMGQGFAAIKCFRLPAYAERFLEKGIAAFLFDYRTFGESDGQPRHHINPFRHIQDWEAALSHVRSLPNIDAARIGIRGSSPGGGHVIDVASKDQGISAVVSQVPYVVPFSTLKQTSLKDLVAGITAGIRDVFRMLTFREPH